MTHSIPDKLRSHNEELNRLTTESITEALVQLVKQSNYEKITVTDICKKAGVSRNAFYHNFKTKEDVLKMIVLKFNKEVILKKLGNPFNKKADINWYEKFFEEIKENADLIRMFLKANLKEFYTSYVNHILAGSASLDKETRYERLLWNGAIQNSAVEWISRGMKESPREMAEIVYPYLNRR